MKKLRDIVILTLALNFLAVAAAVGWLYADGRIDPETIRAIQAVLYPPPDSEVQPEQTEESERDQSESIADPMRRLDALLEEHAGHPAAEQVTAIQHAFEAQMAELNRRRRELSDLQRQVDLARDQLTRDRTALERQQEAFAAERDQAVRLAGEQGFQDSLRMYTTMQPRQAKTIFMTLDDETIQRYLQAMDEREASRIVREFKSPEEIERIQRVLERMRTRTASIEE